MAPVLNPEQPTFSAKKSGWGIKNTVFSHMIWLVGWQVSRWITPCNNQSILVCLNGAGVPTRTHKVHQSSPLHPPPSTSFPRAFLTPVIRTSRSAAQKWLTIHTHQLIPLSANVFCASAPVLEPVDHSNLWDKTLQLVLSTRLAPKDGASFLRHLHARRMNAYIHIWSLEDWWQWACKLYFHREIHTHWTELPGCRQCCELRISAGLIRFDDNWSTAALTGLCLPRGCQVGYLRWSASLLQSAMRSESLALFLQTES